MKKKVVVTSYNDTEKDFAGSSNHGFSLIEATIAMFILLIILMGVFVTFAYAINYNAGNNARSKALAVLQQEVETMRSAKFTPEVTDTTLTGGTKAAKTVTLTDGSKFTVQTTVDDDPSTPSVVDIAPTKTVKEITIQVTVANPTPGWQTAVPAKIVLRRARAN